MVRTAPYTSFAVNSQVVTSPFRAPTFLSQQRFITTTTTTNKYHSFAPLHAMTQNVFETCPGRCKNGTSSRGLSTSIQHQTSTASSPILNGAAQQYQQDIEVDMSLISVDAARSTDVPATTTPTVPKNTFYRRSLPETCVAFSSKLGREYFASAMRHRGLKSYFHLMEQYTTQSEPAYCGISTLVIALNALAVDPRQIWKGSWRWYEESMLNCCIDLEQVKETGITMDAFNCLSLCQGLSTEVYYVDEEKEDVGPGTNSSSLDNFRKLVMEACVESDAAENDDNVVDRVLIASYSRKVLKQTGSGHFSPIAAYDQESDSVLIMDTARFKYGAHWVKLPLIYEAMKPIDPDTGRSRGYVMLVHRKEDDSHRLPNLPMAVILRSEMKQSDTRRKLKEYLSNLGKKVSFEDIANYFHKDGSYQSIWNMVLPQLRPYDNDISTKQMVDELRSLIQLMLNSIRLSSDDDEESVDDSHHCRANHCRTIALRTEEAILVVYLACLDVNDREKMVFDVKYNDLVTESARLQLLAEAELVRYAIDTSDQIPSVMNPSLTVESSDS